MDMDEIQLHMMEMSEKGYYCSQILLKLGLEAQGKQNTDLVRAAGGLALGVGRGAGTCGALSGAACLIALHAGKGCEEEEEDERLWLMLEELWDWFEAEVGARYGGVCCDDILSDGTPRKQRCGPMVARVYGKTMEMLLEHGFDPTESRDG